MCPLPPRPSVILDTHLFPTPAIFKVNIATSLFLIPYFKN